MGRWLPGFAALAGLGVALVGCGSPPWVGKPNVLLLSIESLRWDHLGVAGYERAVSPNIDRLAARGTFFRRTYAQSSWTRPSVASTFSSTYQSTHGVYSDPQPVEGRLQDAKDTECSSPVISQATQDNGGRY